jgi:hypothetical protein
LPVLVVAAAYEAAGARLSENMLPLNPHNAADLQTGSLGDVEICLMEDDSVVTAYEMKMKRVTRDCIGFLRHFLHLFHRIRADYLNAYQKLVLNEPDSAVSQTLKEAFLALRQVAESGE